MEGSHKATERVTYSREIYGTFHLGGDEFAIEMADLQEVVNAPTKVQKMPISPEYLLGLFDLRGSILPVIDLRVLLKSIRSDAEEPLVKSMVVLRRGAACLGLVFDRVGEILRVDREEITPLQQPNLLDDAPRIPIKALISRDAGERIIQVLDFAALLTIRNLPSIEKLADINDSNDRLTSRMRDLYREKLVGFVVGDCYLALELKCIVSIIDNAGKKPSPWASDICESFVTFRGQMVPVVQLSSLLKISNHEECSRILICHIGEHYVGLEVNQISSIIPYAKEKVLPVPVLDEYRSSVFNGCFMDRDQQQFIVLNESGIFSTSELVEICRSHRVKDKEDNYSKAEEIRASHIPVLTFRMGKLYGLSLREVLEVLVSPTELARVPDTPAAVLGVLNLRGTPVSVLDPRQLLSLGEATHSTDSKLLVFQHEKRKIAMQVDSIESIVSVSTGPEDDLPNILFQDEQPKFQGAFERGVQVVAGGEKTVVVVLSADEIVKKLAGALAA